jgi:hypothetical protein
MTNAPGPKSAEAMSLIVAEYQYIGQTAFQANEDRSRVSQLFFLTFGTLIAALYSSQLSPDRVDPGEVQRAFVVLFFTLLFFSLLTLLQLARLRLSWLESVRAMAVLKDAAAKDHTGLEAYFAWTLDERPAPLKLKSVGFLVAISVAWMGALAAGGIAAFVGLLSHPEHVAWSSVLLAGALGFMALLSAYAIPLWRAEQPKPQLEPDP